MNAVLIKIFATALALSQVTTRPDAIKTQFDPVADQQQVVQLLRDGCAHMRKAFDIEDINLDSLITTAMDDPKALTGDVKAFKGLNFNDLYVAYRQFCKNEAVESSPFDAGEVITFFNKAMVDLPPNSAAEKPQAGRRFRGARRQGDALRRDLPRAPARLDIDPPNPRLRAEGVRHRRGQALLPAQGHR